MTYDQAMAALKAAGTEQTRKTWGRHGVDPADCFGVLYSVIYKLAKQAGQDQTLAQRLWSSGNHDARILATYVAEPATISDRTLDAWATECRNYALADAVAALVVRTPHAAARAAAWTTSAHEFTASAGWNVVGGLAMAGAPGGQHRFKKQDAPAALDDAALGKYLTTIERDIGGAPNRVRHSMNNALICIGLRGGRLRDEAISAARRIGKVEVDHGPTSCVTPDAIAYIAKAEARSAGKAVAATDRPGKSAATAKPKQPNTPAVKKSNTSKVATRR